MSSCDFFAGERLPWYSCARWWVISMVAIFLCRGVMVELVVMLTVGSDVLVVGWCKLNLFGQ